MNIYVYNREIYKATESKAHDAISKACMPLISRFISKMNPIVNDIYYVLKYGHAYENI